MKSFIRLLWFVIVFAFFSGYCIAQPKLPEGSIPSNISPEVRAAIDLLYSDIPEQRAIGATQLGAMGLYAVPAVPYLADMLGDEYVTPGGDDLISRPSIGEICARSLIQIGSPSVGYLVNVLEGSNRIAIYNAIFALGEINDPQSITPLLLRINNDDPNIRKLAIKALAKFDDSQIVDSIITKLKDKDPDVRAATVEVLAKKNDPRATLYFIDAIKDPDNFTQYLAIDALIKLNDKRAVKPLIEGLKSDNPNFRKNSALILGTLKVAEAKQPLINAANDPDPFVEEKILWAISEYKDNDTAEIFISKLNSKNSMVRLAAVDGVSKLDSDKAFEPLVGLLRDDNQEIQQKVGEAISKLKNPAVNTVLIDKFKDSHEDLFVRSNSAMILGIRKCEQAKPYLIEGLSSSDINIRKSSALALGHFPDGQTTGILIQSIAKESNAEVKKSILFSLERKNDLSSITVFIEQLNDPDTQIKEIAARALIKITGKNFGFNIDKWKKWQSENKK